MKITLTITIITILTGFSSSLFADSDFDVTKHMSVGQKAEIAQRLPNSVNQASDSTFDKRLPPVLPGEHLGDSGRTMKVWSSSGPVPVASLNNACVNNLGSNCQNTINPGQMGVIVDRRHDNSKSDGH